MTEEIKNSIDLDLDGIISYYKETIDSLHDERNPGKIRKVKGELVENLCEKLVRLTWEKVLSQDKERMEINQEKLDIHIRDIENYKLRPEFSVRTRSRMEAQGESYIYKFSTDKHVFVDNVLVLAIECKSYTEVSMLKRIAFDSMLMDVAKPNATHCLFQLESAFSSEQYHVIMSYHSHDIKTITLLEGKRNYKKPIHKDGCFKQLEKKELIYAIEYFESILSRHI